MSTWSDDGSSLEIARLRNSLQWHSTVTQEVMRQNEKLAVELSRVRALAFGVGMALTNETGTPDAAEILVAMDLLHDIMEDRS